MEGNLSDILLPLTLFPLTGFIVWIGVTNSRRLKMARLQAETLEKLLERLGSNQELLPYLESDAGRRFLEAVTTEKANPHRRILGSMQTGIVLAFLGLAVAHRSGRSPTALLTVS